MKRIDQIFLIIICLIMSSGFIIFLREEKEISYTENRTLSKMPNLTFNNYLNGSYQSDLESGLSDQFIGSETIKKYMNKYTNIVDWNNLNKLICKDQYVHILKDKYLYDCSDYIVKKPIQLSDEIKLSINKRIETFNKLNKKIPVYYYFINRSDNYDFINNEKTIDIKHYFRENAKNYAGIDELEINNYEEYKQLYYKSDHHWNYLGSYTGYRDIASMMNFDNIFEPVEKRVFNVNFNGSLASDVSITSFEDLFTVYKFDIPEHDTYINGVKSDVSLDNSYNNYLNGNYSKNIIYHHYANYYGNDHAEIMYDYNNPKRKNLLIISNSYSNAVRELIAANYNKTYEVDKRHYLNFNIVEFINEKDIDEVLFIGDSLFYVYY